MHHAAVSALMVLLLVESVKSQLNNDICGFTPLCGSQATAFDVSTNFELDFDVKSLEETSLIGGSIIEFSDCCLGRDTIPNSFCETLSPNGIHERHITGTEPLCESFGICNSTLLCEEDMVLIFKPAFIKSQTNTCCETCSCYGDPVCNSFNNVEKTWVLCDGREVNEDIKGKCHFSRNQCESQVDHAGNNCQYVAKKDYGKGWNTVQKGSPCVPNEASGKSLIQMYQVGLPIGDNDDLFNVFALNIEQGERGTINTVYLTLSTGLFTLSALDCLTEEVAWKFTGDQPFTDTSGIFVREEIIPLKNVGWRVTDPFTGIIIDIKCFSNTFDPKIHKGDRKYKPEGGVYVPRINIESLVDPFRDERDVNSTGGFCETDELDTGLASTDITEFIEEQGLCTVGHENQARLDVVRLMCGNPAMTISGELECFQSFCAKNLLPLFYDVYECIEYLSDPLLISEGFCRAVLFSEEDIPECVNHWKEMGGLVTVEQYMSSTEGCVTVEELRLYESSTQCQKGVSIQVEIGEQWEDFLFIPEEICGNEELVLRACDYEELFQERIRIFQKNVDPSCEVAASCSKIDGFFTPIVVASNEGGYY